MKNSHIRSFLVVALLAMSMPSLSAFGWLFGKKMVDAEVQVGEEDVKANELALFNKLYHKVNGIMGRIEDQFGDFLRHNTAHISDQEDRKVLMRGFGILNTIIKEVDGVISQLGFLSAEHFEKMKKLLLSDGVLLNLKRMCLTKEDPNSFKTSVKFYYEGYACEVDRCIKKISDLEASMKIFYSEQNEDFLF